MCMDLLDIMYVVYYGFKILNQLKYHLTSVYNSTIYVGTSRSKISRPCVSVISDPFSSTLLIRHAISLSQHNQYTKSACNVHLSRKFWSGKNFGPRTNFLKKIGPGGPYFSEKNGPPMKKKGPPTKVVRTLRGRSS